MNSPLEKKGANALLVRLHTLDKGLLEAPHAICQQTGAVQQVPDHYRLEDVECKVALRSCKGHGGLVAKHLGAQHGHALALSGVDLAGHDGRTGLVLGKLELSKTAAGTGAEEANVLGDLEEGGGQSDELSVGLDNGVVCGQSLKLVWCRLEFLSRHLAHFSGNILGKALEGVEASADGGTTLSQKPQARKSRLNALDAVLQLLHVAGELLAEGQRSSILQVCPANLDNLVELLRLLVKRILQAVECREQLLLEFEDGGNVHDGREGVVGGGGHVDVVIGVDRLLTAHGSAEDLNGAVGDDFVGVHVGLGARTGLPHDERKVVDELEGGDLGRGLLNCFAELGIC